MSELIDTFDESKAEQVGHTGRQPQTPHGAPTQNPTRGANPKPADPRQLCHSRVWLKPQTSRPQNHRTAPPLTRVAPRLGQLDKISRAQAEIVRLLQTVSRKTEHLTNA
eukprot:scaffold118144_cov45-Phaeocystis_antarctica.AAC.1